MVAALKVRRVGNSLGATIPQEVAQRMNLAPGDSFFLTEAPGGYRLTPYDPEFERQMEAARRIMKKRRNALRELAK
jgi:putative addiction module antidote